VSTGVDVFDTTIQKSIALLKDVSGEFGWPEERRQQAYSALRCVLHVFRDRLPITETANFAAQLPMLVREFYYEGWKPENVPKKCFARSFSAKFKNSFSFRFEGGMERLVSGIMTALSRHIEPRTFEEIKQELPHDLADLLRPAA
jgi:uncharacterized protein (DUF2267 family)